MADAAAKAIFHGARRSGARCRRYASDATGGVVSRRWRVADRLQQLGKGQRVRESLDGGLMHGAQAGGEWTIALDRRAQVSSSTR